MHTLNEIPTLTLTGAIVSPNPKRGNCALKVQKGLLCPQSPKGAIVPQTPKMG